MEKEKLILLKNLLNKLEVVEVSYISEKTVLLNFAGDVRLYIDSTTSGIDFSLEAKTAEAVETIHQIDSKSEH